MGLGRIGRIVAQVLKSLGASRVLYTNKSSTLPPEFQHCKRVHFNTSYIISYNIILCKSIFKYAVGAEKVPLDELLISSDFVISLCVLSDETKLMFNKRAFEKMKKSAVFVNCGRGGLVNQDDLLWLVVHSFKKF